MYFCRPQMQLNRLHPIQNALALSARYRFLAITALCKFTYLLTYLLTYFLLPLFPILTIFSALCSGSRYRKALNIKLFPPHTSSSVFFSKLPARSHHSPDFWIHSIICIGHCLLTISWLQSQDHKPFLRYATAQSWTKLPTLRVPYQSGASSSPSSSPPSGSDPRPVVDISHDVFHSRLESLFFSKSFPPSIHWLGSSHGIWPTTTRCLAVTDDGSVGECGWQHYHTELNAWTTIKIKGILHSKSTIEFL